MLSRATLSSQRQWTPSALVVRLLPQRRLHQFILAVGLIVLVSVMVALTLLTASHRVLLVATGTGSATTGKTSTTLGTVNASAALVRLDQTSMSQYANQQQYTTWSPSTCSAASLTEVINSYGSHYTIADILKVESGIGAITPDQGLLYPEGIDQTAGRFGFTTQTLNAPTLDQVLAIAGGGKPVIVNFPPPAAGGHWDGGHFLVVVGGTTIKGVPYVHLADSSRLNMQYMKVGAPSQWGTFLYYWQGFAKVLTPKEGSTTTTTNHVSSVIGKPTITASFINQVLSRYHSPAAGKGQALYDLGVKYGIDPAFALAFFLHESSFGTAGEARTTRSLGNLRCIPNAACVDQDRGGYASFPSWEAGFEAWYTLIHDDYVAARGLTTIEQIIPVYAPTADHNDEAAYIAALKQAIATWHSGQVTV